MCTYQCNDIKLKYLCKYCIDTFAILIKLTTQYVSLLIKTVMNYEQMNNILKTHGCS